MDEKIAEFARKLDKAGIGLFFYAGHGIQVDGINWLIPVDARIEGGDLRPERAAAVKTASINIAQVLSKMEAEQRVNLVFLDALGQVNTHGAIQRVDKIVEELVTDVSRSIISRSMLEASNRRVLQALAGIETSGAEGHRIIQASLRMGLCLELARVFDVNN
jgi:hypothetical protein